MIASATPTQRSALTLAHALLALGLSLVSAGCGSAPKDMTIELLSSPKGARVYISRRGESTYQGKVGFIKGNVKAVPFEEEMQLVGTTPVIYSSPLKETTTDATMLGVGGRVIKVFKEGVLRFERPGYEIVEQFVRFKDGRVRFDVVMPELTAETQDLGPAPESE